MRGYLPAYELIAPGSLPDALALLDSEPGVWRPFAGGTDLMVLLEAGKLEHRRFVSLWKLPELRGIETTPQEVTLGALTTYTEILAHRLVEREFPLLCRAAAETGGLAMQNRGTLAGNIANASPAADSPPALLVYDAELELVSARGSRRVAYRDFHTGYRATALQPDELIRSIRLPRRRLARSEYYRKVGTRKAQAISKVVMAAAARADEGALHDVRVALGSVAPTVVRCARTEAALEGSNFTPAVVAQAQEAHASEIAPIDDMRSTARYRLRVAQNLLEEFLLQAHDS